MELKEVKNKIGSVKNISELTSALETFSALKMKKTQKKFLESKPFSQKLARVLKKMYKSLNEKKSIFLEQRPVENILFCVVASDRGFCGTFNSNIFKIADNALPEIKKEGKVDILAIGKKAISYYKKQDVKYQFSGVGDYWELDQTKEIAELLVENYKKNNYQKVYLFYTHFQSTFVQKPTKVQLFPLEIQTVDNFLRDEYKTEDENTDYLLEPSAEAILDGVVPVFVEYLIYQFILSANTSEHSARMMAMRNASDNAKGLLEELRLEYNKARQTKITNEVCEISSTAEAMS
ncbi:MAG: ATP synthase F1 subunit gamma [Candidatus Paceibacterota bacterium]|jgi:F-type H+-transporting ATPase subunit gamma|nr:ATP synthase F1 subunit gamma [bacterium]